MNDADMTEQRTGNPAPKPSGPPIGPLLAGLALALSLAAAAALAFAQSRVDPGVVEIGDSVRVAVTVASTIAARERGLSGKDGLGTDEGMLFVFDDPGEYRFWMKDMKFPIDILWIRGDAIADITTDVAVPAPGEVLPTYAPRVPVDRVLEVNAGFARAHGLRIGMPVRMQVDKETAVR
jgi:hypothetical protein